MPGPSQELRLLLCAIFPSACLPSVDLLCSELVDDLPLTPLRSSFAGNMVPSAGKGSVAALLAGGPPITAYPLVTVSFKTLVPFRTLRREGMGIW